MITGSGAGLRTLHRSMTCRSPREGRAGRACFERSVAGPGQTLALVAFS